MRARLQNASEAALRSSDLGAESAYPSAASWPPVRGTRVPRSRNRGASGLAEGPRRGSKLSCKMLLDKELR